MGKKNFLNKELHFLHLYKFDSAFLFFNFIFFDLQKGHFIFLKSAILSIIIFILSIDFSVSIFLEFYLYLFCKLKSKRKLFISLKASSISTSSKNPKLKNISLHFSPKSL